MPKRRAGALPPLKFHKPTGQHCVYLNGDRVPLGADKDAAERRYRQVCKDLLHDRPAKPETSRAGEPLSVAAALLQFMKRHATAYYKDQPKTLARLWEMVDAVRRDHADLPAEQFRGRQLKHVREYLLTERKCKRTGRPLSRSYVNTLVAAAQRCWKWLLSEELVTGECFASLSAVEHVHKGKGGRETARVLPPRPGWDQCLTELPPTLSTMVRVQAFGAMRPQDVCGMRRGDISTSPAEKVEFPGTGVYASAFHVEGVLVWLYIPAHHKTAHLEKPRAVPLGPQSQSLLAPLLDGLAPDDYVFSPARALAERRRGNRFKRTGYSSCYATRQYAQLVGRAIDRCNKRLMKAGIAPDQLCSAWSPNQLRHLQATEVGDRLDEHHARALLGQSSQDMIHRYMEQAMKKAGKAAAECG